MKLENAKEMVREGNPRRKFAAFAITGSLLLAGCAELNHPTFHPTPEYSSPVQKVLDVTPITDNAFEYDTKKSIDIGGKPIHIVKMKIPLLNAIDDSKRFAFKDRENSVNVSSVFFGFVKEQPGDIYLGSVLFSFLTAEKDTKGVSADFHRKYDQNPQFPEDPGTRVINAGEFFGWLKDLGIDEGKQIGMIVNPHACRIGEVKYSSVDPSVYIVPLDNSRNPTTGSHQGFLAFEVKFSGTRRELSSDIVLLREGNQ